MHAILTVFAKEFPENLRERRTLLSALILGPLLGPLLLAGGLSLRLERGAGEADRPLAVAVAHGERAPNLLAFLGEHGVTVTTVDYDASAARAAVRAGREQQVLEIDEDFARRLGTGLPAPLQLYADASDLSAAGDSVRLRALIQQYSSLLGRLRLAARGVDPLLIAPIAVQDIDVSTPA